MTQINPNDLSLGFALSNGNTVIQTTTTVVPCVIGIAVDFTHKKVWAYNQMSGQWNGGAIGSQNPSTNTGGINLTTLMGNGALFPTISYFTTPEAVTANFGATAFTLTMPTGFSAWGSSTTWNPADKSANITLSNGDLTATSAAAGAWCSGRATTSNTTGLLYYEITVTTTDTATGGTIMGLSTSALATNTFTGSSSANSGGWQNTGGGQSYGAFTSNIGNYGNGVSWRTARSTPFKTSGKFVYECTLNAQASSGIMVGFANANGTLANFIGGTDTNSIGAQIGGQPIWYNGNTGTVGMAGSTGTIMVAIDFGNSKAWWYDPSTSKWNNGLIGAQNPATNTGGTTITALAATALAPAVSMFAQTAGTDKVTLNFGATPFVNAGVLPSGFLGWDSYLVPTQSRRLSNDDTDDDQEASNAARIVRRRITGGPWAVNDSLTLNGNAATAQIGSLVINSNPSITGTAATASAGTLHASISKAILGVSGTSHTGTLDLEADPTLSGRVATAGIGTLAKSIAKTITGVEATADIGTVVVLPALDVPITGVHADGHIGTPTIEVDEDFTLTGVAATSHIGTLTAQLDAVVTLTGVVAGANIGPLEISPDQPITGVQTTGSPGTQHGFIQKNLGFPPTLFDPYRGVVAIFSAGTMNFQSDFVLGSVHATASVGHIKVLGALEGVQANTGITRLGWSDAFHILGVESAILINSPLVFVGPNGTNVFLSSVQVSANVGALRLAKSTPITGVSADAQVGALQTLISQGGFAINMLEAVTVPVVNTQADVSIRWSDSRGASWNTPIIRTLGDAGRYATNIQVLNMGIARDRIYEISWSAPDATALTGMWLRYEDSLT